MKKWIFTFAILLLAVGLYYLASGSLKWQPLTILFAALAAPIKFITGLFGNPEEEIRQKHEALRQREQEYQQSLQTRIAERQERIRSLQREIDVLDARLIALEEKRNRIRTEIENMDVEQRRRAGQDLFGQ